MNQIWWKIHVLKTLKVETKSENKIILEQTKWCSGGAQIDETDNERLAFVII